eukprot:673910-Amphidinium_carterae.1
MGLLKLNVQLKVDLRAGKAVVIMKDPARSVLWFFISELKPPHLVNLAPAAPVCSLHVLVRADSSISLLLRERMVP